jgi:hypothetical protein
LHVVIQNDRTILSKAAKGFVPPFVAWSHPKWLDKTFKKLQWVLCFHWLHGVIQNGWTILFKSCKGFCASLGCMESSEMARQYFLKAVKDSVNPLVAWSHSKWLDNTF